MSNFDEDIAVTAQEKLRDACTSILRSKQDAQLLNCMAPRVAYNLIIPALSWVLSEKIHTGDVSSQYNGSVISKPIEIDTQYGSVSAQLINKVREFLAEAETSNGNIYIAPVNGFYEIAGGFLDSSLQLKSIGDIYHHIIQDFTTTQELNFLPNKGVFLPFIPSDDSSTQGLLAQKAMGVCSIQGAKVITFNEEDVPELQVLAIAYSRSLGDISSPERR